MSGNTHLQYGQWIKSLFLIILDPTRFYASATFLSSLQIIWFIMVHDRLRNLIEFNSSLVCNKRFAFHLGTWKSGTVRVTVAGMKRIVREKRMRQMF